MPKPTTEKTFEFIDATPKIGAEWLEKNHRNRPMSAARVRDMANTMAHDEWRTTAEPIMFCDEWKDPITGEEFGETLMEGQHRAAALVKSGKTVTFLVVRHCDPREFEVIGHGKERSHTDVLHITRRDIKYPNLVSSIVTAFVRFSLRYGNRIDFWMVREVIAALQPEILRVVAHKQKLKGLVRREFLAALLLAEIIDPERTAGIVNNLRAGLGYTKSEPAKPLRVFLYDCVVNPKKELPDSYFYKVSQGLAQALQGTSNNAKLRINPEGIAWLRTKAKSKLGPLVKTIYGKTPDGFYAAELSPRMAGRAKEDK